MPTSPLAAELFAIATDHSRTPIARVDDMVPLLLAVEGEKFQVKENAWNRSDHYWEYFKPQVLRNRESEHQFFGAFMQEIFKKYEHIESFSWRQAQEYNDNWDYFDLHSLFINDQEIQFDAGFDKYDNPNSYCILESGTYYYPSGDFSTTLLMEFGDEKTQQEIKELAIYLNKIYYEKPYEVFQVFLQSLHRAYHVNYFIDLFGWVSSVHIDASGIKLEGVQRYPPRPMGG